MALRIRLWLIVICWLVAVRAPSPAAEASDDEQLLRAAGLASDGPALLDFFRKQTADETTLQRARVLIVGLGSDSFRVREKASRELATFGPAILPLLRQTIRATSDLEVRRRARACAEEIQARSPAALAEATARLLALRRPPGAAETLLAFLPGPYDASVTEAIHDTLVVVARLNGGLAPVFVASLASPTPARRVAAAVTLCRLGSVEHWPAVRKLLHDRETGVRVQVALELAGAGDKEAVPTLIELLAQLSVEQAGPVEEFLFRLAGARSPQVPLSSAAEAQRRCRDAWRDWWHMYGAHVEMAVLKEGERPLGYMLLVLLNDNRVVEWDREGKPRWQINGLGSPLDAEVLPGQRVLIAEHNTKRVTERSFKGEVLWEKKLSEPPIHAQRLPGGITFIATRQQLLEVDRSGAREVVRYRSGSNDIITACRFRDGRIGCIEKGSYFELDAGGKERKRFAIVPGVFTTNSLTPLPNGNLLIASYGGGTVQEYDRSGKIVWQIQMGRPLCALRLPSGNTLVSSQDMVLIEYDRSGKEVARHIAQGHPCQIRRR
ncbi:MAG TPA: HEAT repeat domain-containing protein [Gemmataceae bacterium]|jgi:hypothetical protein